MRVALLLGIILIFSSSIFSSDIFLLDKTKSISNGNAYVFFDPYEYGWLLLFDGYTYQIKEVVRVEKFDNLP